MTPATHENARLEELAALVLPGLPALDVGTDHAYLPMALVDRGICPHVIASDRSPAVIARLRAALRDSRFADRIEPVHADGLDSLAGRRAATVVIAGMGGHAIAGILARGRMALDEVRRLVIAPQRDAPVVRRALHALGWGPREERLVESRGRFYWVLAAEADRTTNHRRDEPLDELDVALGSIARRRGDPCFLRFALAQQSRLASVLAGLDDAGTARTLARRERLSRIHDALSKALEEARCTGTS